MDRRVACSWRAVLLRLTALQLVVTDMYQPDDFRVDDVPRIHALMRAKPFAALVSSGAVGLYATHLPTLLKDEGSFGTVECHLARANPQWKQLAESDEALMIFQGAEGYITPNWYPSKAEHGKVVPTWNYAIAHAYGRPEVINDKDWLRRHVAELTAQQEAHGADTMVAIGCARNLCRGHAARHRRHPPAHRAVGGQVEDEPEPRGERSRRRRARPRQPSRG